MGQRSGAVRETRVFRLSDQNLRMEQGEDSASKLSDIVAGGLVVDKSKAIKVLFPLSLIFWSVPARQ